LLVRWKEAVVTSRRNYLCSWLEGLRRITNIQVRLGRHTKCSDPNSDVHNGNTISGQAVPQKTDSFNGETASNV
jgi:hypothetical protein